MSNNEKPKKIEKFLATLCATGNKPASAPTPNTNVILVTIEPTALPKASSAEPLMIEVIEVATSGKVVPRDTIVAPIINSGIPIASAISTAFSTNRSADLVRPIKDTMKIKISKNSGNCANKVSIISPIIKKRTRQVVFSALEKTKP